MIDVRNRVVEHQNRYKLKVVEGQPDTYDFEEVPGEVTDEGTEITRSLLMAMQGFVGKKIVFHDDQHITETNSAGDTMTTVFYDDGTIVETFTSGQLSISKKTVFNADGSIEEVLV